MLMVLRDPDCRLWFTSEAAVVKIKFHCEVFMIWLFGGRPLGGYRVITPTNEVEALRL